MECPYLRLFKNATTTLRARRSAAACAPTSTTHSSPVLPASLSKRSLLGYFSFCICLLFTNDFIWVIAILLS